MTEKKSPMRIEIVRSSSRTIVPQSLAKHDTGEGLLAVVLKAEKKDLKASKQKTRFGLQNMPFDPSRVKELRSYNIHHATSINTKVACTVGIGFEDDPKAKADKAAKQAEKNPPPPPAPGMPPMVVRAVTALLAHLGRSSSISPSSASARITERTS